MENKEEWVLVVSYKTELLSEFIIHKGYQSIPKLLPNLPPFNNRMIIDNDIYIDTNETNKIQEKLAENLILNASEIYKVIEKQSKKLIELAQGVCINIKNLSNVELLKRLNKFFSEYQKSLGLIGIPTLIDLELEKKVKKYIMQIKFKNIEQSLSNLAIPFKPIETSNEKLELFDIATKINSEKIAEHYKKYGWIHSTLFLGEDYDEIKIKEEIKLLSNAKEEKQEIIKEREKQFEEAEKVIKQINSNEGKNIARFFQKAVYYRTARLEWINKACFIVKPLLKEIAKRLNLEFAQLIYMLPEEIEESLKNNSVNISLLEEIKQRREGYALISDNKNQCLLLIGEKLDELKKKFSRNHQGNTTIVGLATFNGKAKGIVKIVRDRSELNKINKGDILVTSLTTPDFIVAMKKASGIITDLGGITSHAAIVSRELNIPCVVGTKNATSVLKDGDLVEINENGLIKILKRFNQH